MAARDPPPRGLRESEARPPARAPDNARLGKSRYASLMSWVCQHWHNRLFGHVSRKICRSIVQKIVGRTKWRSVLWLLSLSKDFHWSLLSQRQLWRWLLGAPCDGYAQLQQFSCMLKRVTSYLSINLDHECHDFGRGGGSYELHPSLHSWNNSFTISHAHIIHALLIHESSIEGNLLHVHAS